MVLSPHHSCCISLLFPHFYLSSLCLLFIPQGTGLFWKVSCISIGASSILVTPSQLWAGLVLFFFMEIPKQDCPNWHNPLREEDRVNVLLSLLISKISLKNSNRDFNKFLFPEAALVIRVLWPSGDTRAIVLGISPLCCE